ncbi:HNH endonuclease [Erwinia phage Ea35-70]|uniref:Putative HNH endonuclease n=3 Tax=Agricanvirus TaxID=1984776 RepID=W6ARX8_9CAUD|nr:HNH endonuclease [Erwinia phage Ea35-70]YP_009605847.1 HNH endonuclease [Erwinia phage vB_EamM_Simmy50]AHI60211.1 putative HNH endonuclease [Erwinia phage Ea35-70]ANH51525.1 putative HNH endonuclease [Erwinia phage vB_EamM_Simmy50]AUG86811.1 putative HNH endonuclease [Erwinia phage vB_EamM_Mortimer]
MERITLAWLRANQGRKSLEDRLFQFGHVYSERDSCFTWRGMVDNYGYGKIKVKSRLVGAHKLSYLLFKGDIPEGMVVRHTCDNPVCINPSHLIAGTVKQNVHDAIAKGRASFQNAINSSVCKFLPANAIIMVDRKIGPLLCYATTRRLALADNSKVYWGRPCKSHGMPWRRTSNGECVYCRHEYRAGVKYTPNGKR